MPSREYYLADTDGKAKAAYLHLMVAFACLLGADRKTATVAMKEVLQLEDKLANVRVDILCNIDSYYFI